MNATGVSKELDWSCLFPAENGAFFLNYVMTSAFVGIAFEMIRIAEVLFYATSMILFARTSAEYLTARQKTKFDFYFGIHYPRILLLFTLIVTFSISSPLIAPVGMSLQLYTHTDNAFIDSFSCNYSILFNLRSVLYGNETLGGQVSHIPCVCAHKNQSTNPFKGYRLYICLTSIPINASVHSFGSHGLHLSLIHSGHHFYSSLFIHII